MTVLCANRPASFLPVPTTAVPANDDFRLSVYLWNSASRSYRFYRGPSCPLTPEDLNRLKSAGVETLYLDSVEYATFQESLRSDLDRVISDESLSPAQRMGVLNSVVRDVLRDSFHWANFPRLVEQVTRVAEHTVDLLCRDDCVVSELCSVLCHDHGTFTHSANVAYYSVLLAKGLGYFNRDDLAEIAAGAMLHDVGKLEIPREILTKRSTLTDSEIDVMRRHPAIGLKALRSRNELTYGQLMMVYQHHERIDGGGYPVRVQKQEIHPWARICAVADVFDALTSNRPYRTALSQITALELMDRDCGSGFDPEVIRCWQETIATS